MVLDETIITRAIIERFTEKLLACVDLDVAIVGGGVSGLVAGWRLGQKRRKVAIFERKLTIGGGMWGGGMMFNEIVVQEAAKHLLDELDITSRPYGQGYYTADAIEAVTTLGSKAMKAGARLFNCIHVEDVMVRENRVTGLVIGWSPVEIAGLHVDPMTIRSKYVIDATGHDVDIVKIFLRKNPPAALFTETGGIMGERSMWADVGEAQTVEYSKEVYPGLFVSSMAATASWGTNRMGPIFGGMLLSGERAAELIEARLATE